MESIPVSSQLTMPFTTVSYGYCHCGCGGKTKICTKTDPKKNWVKGEPLKYIYPHGRQTDLATRFWSKVDCSGECWIYTGPRRGGFGHGAFTIGDKTCAAHRIAWQLIKGPIPAGKQLNHKCNNPPCCRIHPDHVYAGTHQENMDDKVRSGRQARGETHGSKTHPERIARGDRHSSRTHPERVARGNRHGSVTKPESIRRGDQSWSRMHPERLARGDRSGAHTHPERIVRGEDHPRAILTPRDVQEIRTVFAAGNTTKMSLARRFNVSHNTIRRVIARETWNHVT